MAKITNPQSLQKKINDAIRKKVESVLTPEELKSVEFEEVGGKLTWITTEEIREKIMASPKK